MNDVTRELGGAFGIAVIGSMLTAGYRRSVQGSDALPEPLVDPIADSAGAGLAIAGETAAQGDEQLAGSIVDTVQSAIADGFGQAMLLAAAVAIVGAVYVAIRTPRTSSTTGTTVSSSEGGPASAGRIEEELADGVT